ncbi:coiled-coil domain-containing protein [Haloglycomyces albus]|uniref:coiled-coil domain-containing protein n=1 Tax=Haloglycomyces albus TaxID=526067 RepID=UPI0004B6E491|nr:hypothetical protein [Haloglycomyces albus]
MTRLSTRSRKPVFTSGILLLVLFLLPPSQSLAQDDELEEHSVSEELSSAITDYLEAMDKLEELQQKEKDLETELEDAEERQKELKKELADFAGIALQQSDMYSLTTMLASDDNRDMLEAMTMLDFLGESRAERVDTLIKRIQEIDTLQDDLDENIAEQERLTKELDEARESAALSMAGAGGDSAVGPEPGNFPTPEAVPRNPNGSLPYESCSESDPTTNGCISPRTRHGVVQSQLAGFTRYTACFRNGSWGDHPQGKACDYSVTPGGFKGVATGTAKQYGDNLAAWFVENADRLGIKYVIWYKMFWSPTTGWTNYNLANGDPNTDHTNHVHTSWR